MRITFVLPYAGLSGGTRVVAIYAERLMRWGHKVTVVSTPQRPVPLRHKLKALLIGNGWPSESPRAPYLDGTNACHHVIDRWRPVTDADTPDGDVVIATWWMTAEWVARLSPQKGAKAYFLQGFELQGNEHDEQLKATWMLPLHKIVVGGWLASVAEREFGDRFVDVVPNSVDLRQFRAPPRGKRDVATVGTMYTTAAIKGCAISLKAVLIARWRLPELRLVAFGATGPGASLPLPSGTRYFRSPPQAQLKNIYAGCDAWLFTSRCEGFGLPILEAMACRTPVIGTPAGAAPELLAGGGGLLVKPEDPVDVARGIERICALSDREWRAMSDAAYATATRYTWDDATNLFEAALEKAIERGRRGRVAAHGLGG